MIGNFVLRLRLSHFSLGVQSKRANGVPPVANGPGGNHPSSLWVDLYLVKSYDFWRGLSLVLSTILIALY